MTHRKNKKEFELLKSTEVLIKRLGFTAIKKLRTGGSNSEVLLIESKQKPNEKFVLKIARSEQSSLQLRNNIRWTNSILKNLPKDLKFSFPKIFDYNLEKENFFWVVMEYVDGEAFANSSPDQVHRINIKNPEACMRTIAELINYIEKQSLVGLKGIDLRVGKFPRTTKHHMLEQSIRWGLNDNPYFIELLKLILANYKNLGTANAHCDINPLNLMISRDGKLYLIDADLGNNDVFRYYDAVEFYKRIYTVSERPDLAKLFLKEYIDLLGKGQERKFLNNFLCLLAFRCIGEFYELKQFTEGTGKRRYSTAVKFAKDIVTYKVLEY